MATRLGVVTQILQPERVLMLCMKTKEDVNSTRLEHSVLLNEKLIFLVTHDTHRRTIVESRKTIPTKVVFHVPVETLLYEKSKLIIDKRRDRGLEMDLQMLYW